MYIHVNKEDVLFANTPNLMQLAQSVMHQALLSTNINNFISLAIPLHFLLFFLVSLLYF